MLLNQNDKGRTKRNENLPQKYEIVQVVDAQQEEGFQLEDHEETKEVEQKVPLKKKPSKKSKKPESDKKEMLLIKLASLRSRTETPSKAINVTQEIDHREPKLMVPQDKNIGGLTRWNLQQLDAMNNKKDSQSPGKLLQKHLERQQRAEMLRA